MMNFRLRTYVLNKMEDESDSDSSVDDLKIERLKEAAVCAETIVAECRSNIVAFKNSFFFTSLEG